MTQQQNASRRVPSIKDTALHAHTYTLTEAIQKVQMEDGFYTKQQSADVTAKSGLGQKSLKLESVYV